MGRHLQTIHGHKVYADDDRGKKGLKYLAYDLEDEACRALFDQVEKDGQASFTDEDGRAFSLVDGERGSFSVVAEHERRGWF